MKKVLYLLFPLLTFASCSRDVKVEETSNVTRIEASCEKNTKASLAEGSNTSIVWNDGDKIAVQHAGEPAKTFTTASFGEGRKTAVFKGEKLDAKKYVVQYPQGHEGAVAKSDDTGYEIQNAFIPSLQLAQEESFDKKSFYAVGMIDGPNSESENDQVSVKLRNVLSFIKVEGLKEEWDIANIALVSLGNEVMTGSINVYYDSSKDELSSKAVDGKGQTYVSVYPLEEAPNGFQTYKPVYSNQESEYKKLKGSYYFSILPQNYEKGLALIITRRSQYKNLFNVVKKFSAVDIKAGHLKKIKLTNEAGELEADFNNYANRKDLKYKINEGKMIKADLTEEKVKLSNIGLDYGLFYFQMPKEYKTLTFTVTPFESKKISQIILTSDPAAGPNKGSVVFEKDGTSVKTINWEVNNYHFIQNYGEHRIVLEQPVEASQLKFTLETDSTWGITLLKLCMLSY